ncbi:hypothetical protein AB1Y20_008699 [Prymnesium parvum]|uniref:JmjC domain-containing protein n=1 Tax=Prymnesium parvum TaxID=97485 RepID=A0AB34ITT2_PRYPA
MVAAEALLHAAGAHDLPLLHQLLALPSHHAPARGALDRRGTTLAHALLAALRLPRGGRVSHAVEWQSSNLSLYRHDVVQILAEEVRATLGAVLRLAPPLAWAADVEGVTPLHLAASNGVESLAELLLRAGGSPTAAAANGLTPLQVAAATGNVEVLRLMLRALNKSARLAATRELQQIAAQPGAALLPQALLELSISPVARRPPRVTLPVRERRSDEGGCEEGGGWDVERGDAARLRCDIDSISADISDGEFYRDYFLPQRPVIVRGFVPLRERCHFARARLQAKGRTSVMYVRTWCGRTAYPSLTGQTVCGEFSMEDMNRHPVCNDSERTRPVCVRKPHRGNVNGTVGFKQIPVRARYAPRVPVAPFLTSSWEEITSRQLFMGGNLSGAAMHFHSAAYNMVFFGNKHWLLTPPRWAALSGAKSTDWEATARARLPSYLPLRCSQGPGDMMLLPFGWGHATINLGFSVGVGNLFCDKWQMNLTGHARCADMHSGQQSKDNLKARLLSALGGKWPTGNDFNFKTPPPPAATPRRELHRRLQMHGNSRPRPPPLLRLPPRAGCEPNASAYTTVAFVHINKAGGTAMRAILYKHSSHQLLELVVPEAAARMRQLRSRFFHASASLQREAFGLQRWRASFTFALVRNPWARQVSMFHFLLSEASCVRPIGVRPAHCELRKLPAAGAWLKIPAEATRKFRAWVRDLYAAFPPGHKDAHLFGARSHGNERDPWYNASQISWLIDGEGKLLVDRVIKLEELEAQWPLLQREICGLANVPYADNGLRRNPSSHGHYSEYFDDDTRRIVAEYMAADILYFGYAFEQPSSNK